MGNEQTPHPARSARGAPFGGAAERSEAEGVYSVGCCRRMVSTAPVGADSIRPKPWTFVSTRLNGTSFRNCPLASPRGVAERSESFKIMIAGGNHSKIRKLDFLISGTSEPLIKKD